MTESARTISYVVAAAVSAVAAWLFIPSVDVTPERLASANLGKPFFADFKDPNEPTSIRVVTYDEDRAIRKPFAVELKDGKWTIPSHHDYPADGKTRLAKTAASSIDIKRDEFKSSSDQDHTALGVVDPLDEDSTKLKGRGQRVTLSKGNDTLFDLIIGKQLRDRPGYYYVRRPDEKSTYVAKIDIDLSTKFEDWVETDLLKLERNDLTQIVMDNYAFDTAQQRPVDGELNKLERAKSGDPWKLEGLDEKTEEVNTAKVNDIEATLDELKLVGIRQKPKGINADLTVDREFVQNKLQIQLLLQDLRSRGFEIGADRDDEQRPRLYARGGELEAGTSKGVVYTLRFGDVFTGGEMEIEAGIEADKKEADAAEAKKEGDPAEGEKKDDKADGSVKSSRYMFVSTHFDEKYLGDAPVKPERPEGLTDEAAAEVEKAFENKAPTGGKPKVTPGKPNPKRGPPPKEEEEEDEAPPKKSAPKQEEGCGGPALAAIDEEASAESPAEEKSAAAEADEPAKPAEEKPASEQPAAEDKPEPPAAETTDAKPAEPKAEEKKPTLEELKKTYKILLEKHAADVKAYDDKVTAGEEKVAELNRRFSDWYYVISVDSYNKLHVARKDLVKEKGATPAGGAPGLPGSLPQGLQLPGASPAKPGAPASKVETKTEDSAATDKSDSEEAPDESAKPDQAETEAKPEAAEEKPSE